MSRLCGHLICAGGSMQSGVVIGPGCWSQQPSQSFNECTSRNSRLFLIHKTCLLVFRIVRATVIPSSTRKAEDAREQPRSSSRIPTEVVDHDLDRKPHTNRSPRKSRSVVWLACSIGKPVPCRDCQHPLFSRTHAPSPSTSTTDFCLSIHIFAAQPCTTPRQSPCGPRRHTTTPSPTYLLPHESSQYGQLCSGGGSQD